MQKLENWTQLKNNYLSVKTVRMHQSQHTDDVKLLTVVSWPKNVFLIKAKQLRTPEYVHLALNALKFHKQDNRLQAPSSLASHVYRR